MAIRTVISGIGALSSKTERIGAPSEPSHPKRMKYPVWAVVCQPIFNVVELWRSVNLDNGCWNGYIIQTDTGTEIDHFFMNGYLP
jgi:hypothetical protein